MNVSTIWTLALVYFALYLSFLWIVLYSENKKTLFIDPKTKRYPLVSIVIPIYGGNTKEEVLRAVNSCKSLTYPKKEIIIAWNGKKSKLYDFCKSIKGVKVISTQKKGKAAGMNEALKYVKGELFTCLDADSYLEKDSLNHVVGYFEDKKVGAVAMSMRVAHPKTWVEKIQWVDYIFGIYLRKLATLLNALYVISGPGGTYRTSTIKKIGGFDEENLTEDMEIAYRLQVNGYKIKNSLNAFVYTSAPKNMWGLILQRMRWYGGTVLNAVKYKQLFFNPKSGVFGMLILPASFVWVVVALYYLILIIKDFFMFIFSLLRTLVLTNFDFRIYLNLLKSSMLPGLSYTYWYLVIFLGISVLVMYVSLKLSKERVDMQHKYIGYMLYFLANSILMGIFWIFTLAYLAIRPKYDMLRW